MRIAIGSIFQETNTFSPRPTTLESFEAVYLWRGDEVFSKLQKARIEIPGILSVLEPQGIEAIPLICPRSPNEKRRPSEAATVATRSAAGDILERRR